MLDLFPGEPVEVETSLRPVNGTDRGSLAILPVVRPSVPGDHPILNQVCLAARARHLRRYTEQVYTHWIKRFMSFHEARPLADSAVTIFTNPSCKRR